MFEWFDELKSKLAIKGAMYWVAANHEWMYSPKYKKPPVAIVVEFNKCP